MRRLDNGTLAPPHGGPLNTDERRYLEAIHDAIASTSEETDDNYLATIRTIMRNTRASLIKEAKAAVNEIGGDWIDRAGKSVVCQALDRILEERP
jgi:hypothetical protein